MSCIEFKLKKLKNMHKYFVFHISNKNPKKLQMMLIYFLKIILHFLIINFNCIIIYKLYILIFKLNSNNLFILYDF